MREEGGERGRREEEGGMREGERKEERREEGRMKRLFTNTLFF